MILWNQTILILILREIEIAIFRKVGFGLVIFRKTQIEFTLFLRVEIVTPLLKFEYYNLYKYIFYAEWKSGW